MQPKIKKMADNNSSSKTPLIIILLLSLGLNGYLFYSGNKKSDAITNLTSRVYSLSTATANLSVKAEETSAKLGETEVNLEEFRGKNAELDSLLTVANKEISAKKARISELKKDASKKKELEAELASLKVLQENYLERIDSLITVNNLLKQEVVTYQATVQQQSDQLASQQSTIDRGSIISSDNILAVPLKQKGSGKFVPTAIASKTKRVEVCFDLLENKISKPGTKIIYLQVISPEGVVLGTDASGAGNFTVKDDNSQARYTSTTTIEYQNKRKNYCVGWSYDLPLVKGNYSVKVYTESAFSGVGAFILK